MKVITFEQLFHYPNSDQWLYEEVSARLLLTTITFKSKTGKFIKVSEIYFLFLAKLFTTAILFKWKGERTKSYEK